MHSKRVYLIHELLRERPRYRHISVPQSVYEQRQLLRSLMNVRSAEAVSDEFLKVQDHRNAL